LRAMQLGLDSYCYHRHFGEVYPGQAEPGVRWTLADFIDLLPSFHPDCVSLETSFLPDDQGTLLRSLSRLTVPAMFAWGHPHGFMEKRESEVVAEVGRYLYLSAHLGYPVLRVVGSSIAHYWQPHEPQIAMTVQRLGSLLPLAEKLGIRLALENHGDFFKHELTRIVREVDSPYLGFALDTGNLLRFDEDPVQAVEEWAEKVLVVHAKDVALMEGFEAADPRRLACVPAGKGMNDFPSIFSALKKVNFEGSVLIEISRMHPDYEQMGETQMIQDGLAYLRGLRSDVNEDGGYFRA
jgi:3-oxoisoapionate decarboxylase